ncbi:MAG TPA: ABC transporter permease [Chloroflexi bacterium]|jgi:putative spermidine/putrescine transport system permease protein|nr:ABC transporter permease [Chloroflexota bacterium]
MVLPTAIVVTTSFSTTRFISFPPVGFSLDWYRVLLEDVDFQRAFVVSVEVAALAALTATVLAIGAALALERFQFPGHAAVSAALLGPLMVPGVALAIGMLFFLTAIGLIDGLLGLVIAHSVVVFPFALRVLLSAMAGVREEFERCAAVLGASPLMVLRRVTLPLMAPGLAAAALLSSIISFNNFSITVFIAGPTTQTLPLVIFARTQFTATPELSAAATVLLLASIVLIWALDRLFGVQSVLGRA